MKHRQDELLSKARRALAAARRDAAAGDPDFATSRAYYACFYAAEAALLARGMSFSSHSALMAAFGREFARTGRLPTRLHAILIKAFDRRNVSDYGSGSSPSSEDAATSIAAAEEFVAAIQAFLQEKP